MTQTPSPLKKDKDLKKDPKKDSKKEAPPRKTTHLHPIEGLAAPTKVVAHPLAMMYQDAMEVIDLLHHPEGEQMMAHNRPGG